MSTAAPIIRRALLAALASTAVGGCLQESGRAPPPPPPPPVCEPTLPVPAGVPFAPDADCTAAPGVPAGQPFTVSGTATYDLVRSSYDPATGGGGLDFAGATPRPVRGADVVVLQCGAVLAATTTDDSGHYTATFTPGATGRIQVAVLARTASPPIRVQDNTDADAVWAMAKPLDAPTPTLDIHATHGFDGCTSGPWRIAAPFAILDSMYTASRRLLDIPRGVPFASFPLEVNWSPANVPSDSYYPPAGLIITSHYDPDATAIYILGAEGIDSDEFDRSVIVHEWSHYFEDNLSRSDSPGGPHGLGWILDPRLSFGEGYATAYAAMLLDDPIYADTAWSGASTWVQVGWDAETVPPPSRNDDPFPGPFSELSVIRALWDLYDPANDDTAALGLAPIYDTLVGPQRNTPALTTLASFIAGLKGQAGVSASAVNAVLAQYSIGPVTTEWGDGDADLRLMFDDVTVPSSVPASLDGRYYWNEQPQNRYFVFTATGAQTRVTTTSSYDVDLEAYHFGTCSVPTPCGLLAGTYTDLGNETLTFGTTPGELYVVVLTGWGGLASPVGTYSATVAFATP